MEGNIVDVCGWLRSQNDKDKAMCPHCKKTWGDLWDYEWGSREIIVTDCPHCGAEVMLKQHVTITYGTKATEAT